jgi:predicted anti-sigma-YlaC factor YlaD
MWYLLQIAIIVWLCIAHKFYLAPDVSMGHILLFSTLVAFLATWLISRAIDLVRSNSRTCFLIALLITGAVIIWLTANSSRSLDAALLAVMGGIGLCIFVPSIGWFPRASYWCTACKAIHPPATR